MCNIYIITTITHNIQYKLRAVATSERFHFYSLLYLLFKNLSTRRYVIYRPESLKYPSILGRFVLILTARYPYIKDHMTTMTISEQLKIKLAARNNEGNFMTSQIVSSRVSFNSLDRECYQQYI